MPSDNPTLTPGDVAKRLQVTPYKVRAWIRAGRLPARDFGTNPNFPRYLISEKAVQDFLDESSTTKAVQNE